MKTGKNVFTKEFEWSGYSVRPGKAGWIMESWSRLAGQVTGRKELLAYDDQFPRNMDCKARWNSSWQNGEALRYVGTTIKVLCKGTEVR